MAFKTLFFVIPVALWLLVNFLIIVFRNRRAKRQIRLVKQRVNDNDIVMKGIKMKFIWTSRSKQYISFITNCDIYIVENFSAVVPFQIFPFKAYHEPILLTSNVNSLKRKFQSLDIFRPDKLTVRKDIRSEIQIEYHENHNNYQICLKELTVDDRNRLEILRNCC
jgi:hypothetical protein